MRLETEREQEARKQHTIADTVALMEELFDDTAVLSVATHRSIPKGIMIRVHDQIRKATATGGVTMEVRTWVSELQVATGNQGESWIRDWPAKGNRVRHVQLLERRGWDEYRVLWTTSNLRLDE